VSDPKDVFAELVRRQQRGEPVVLCTVVRTAGSTPRKQAARMLVGATDMVGTIGGGRVEKQVLDAARALLQKGDAAEPALYRYHLTRELGMCCGGEMEVFVEPLCPAPNLIVCGGGHVAQALVPLCRPLGFCPILVEDLEELGNRERFPDVERIIDSFAVRDWQGVPLDQRSYAVIVTRDHQQDQDLLEQLLPYDLAYLGLIGSQRKILMFQQRLINKGVDKERLARVHAPIGLPIGAQTPSEIAIAIAAELIAVRAARREPRAAGRTPVRPADAEPTRPQRDAAALAAGQACPDRAT
jgi:xanthine dehydrogenase accessory factor